MRWASILRAGRDQVLGTWIDESLRVLGALALATVLVTGCGSGDDTVTAAVISVSIEHHLEQGSSSLGSTGHFSYGGTVTVELPDGNTVQATCSEELAASLEGCPEFTADSDTGGLVAVGELTSIDPGQEVRVKESETGESEWEVVSLAD